MEETFLSVIIPAFNEGRRIGSTLERVLDYVQRQGYSAEVLVVDDGSTDDTSAVVRSLASSHPSLRLVERRHRGKGGAVKAGMLEARGSYRFLCDADLAMPVEEIAAFLPPALEDVDIAIGSREAAGSRRHGEPAYRHLMGRTFNWIVRAIAVHGLRDTQCGFKCFRGRVAEQLFAQQRLDGFGFDVEILFLAQKGGLRIVEVPINWYYQRESKVHLVRDAFQMVREALQVRWNHLLGRYRISRSEATALEKEA